MMYNYMTLNDGTGIAHSEVIYNNDEETVKVYFEQPVDGGFNCAECWLPTYSWTKKRRFFKGTIRLFARICRKHSSYYYSTC